jgi:hypothetical protein
MLKLFNSRTLNCVLILVLGILCFSLFLPFADAASNSFTDYSVDWASINPSAGGHLTVSCPKILEEGQTYEVKVTLTLEWISSGDSLEFQRIQWLISNENSGNQTLGYSVLDPFTKIHQSLSTISHWSLTHNQLNGTGTITMNTTVLFHNSLQPLETQNTSSVVISPAINVSLMNKSSFFLTTSPKHIAVGEKVLTNGTLLPPVPGALINITYVKPNGDKVGRWAITDSQGIFNNSYTTDVDGTWLVQVSWAGNESTSADPSNLVTFNVEKQGSLIPISSLVIFVLAIVILALIKFINPIRNFSLKREKPKI